MIEEGCISEETFPCKCLSVEWSINGNRLKDKWKRNISDIHSPSFYFTGSYVRIRMRNRGKAVQISVYADWTHIDEYTVCRVLLKDRRRKDSYEAKSVLGTGIPCTENSPSILIPISAISNNGEENPFRFITVSCELQNLTDCVQKPFSHCQSQTECAEKRSPNEQKDAASQTQTINIPTGTGGIQSASNICKLQQDYKKLSETPEEADVCLKVGEREFRAHKCILRARSTVFHAMFKHGMKEAVSGEVVIEDLDARSFPVFLEHLYAGSVGGLSQSNACNLFTAADKYDMQELKAQCKTFIKQTLSTDTFCDLMVLAIKHQDDELLSLAVDYFSKNMSQVVVTVKWQNFMLTHTIEANELLVKALVSKKE